MLASLNVRTLLLGQGGVGAAIVQRARLSCRAMSSTAKALMFEKSGEPEDVLQLKEQQLPALGDADVQIQIIAVSVLLPGVADLAFERLKSNHCTANSRKGN